MDTGYVSEFTVFINQYLEQHPQVVEEQQRGWRFFWAPKIDLPALNETQEYPVRDDSYGFSWAAWRAESPETAERTKTDQH